jgi:hypothetical protein
MKRRLVIIIEAGSESLAHLSIMYRPSIYLSPPHREVNLTVKLILTTYVYVVGFRETPAFVSILKFFKNSEKITKDS